MEENGSSELECPFIINSFNPAARGSRLETMENRPPISSRYFQHAHFIPAVGVGKRGAYQLVHGDPPRQHSFGTTLRFTGPVPGDSRQ